ncbi:MAG: hypothetical protein HOP13_05920 [Alphaproteobacteria bacterium]|nr:hypothetical protein [Alphaproteobacteria bacterium]
MPSLVWASVFLFLVMLGFVVGCAGMIGMPIAAEVHIALFGGAFLLAGFGWLLFVASSQVNSARVSSAFNL